MVKLCNITASHSSCSDFNIAGILVAVGGLGLTSGDATNKSYLKLKYTIAKPENYSVTRSNDFNMSDTNTTLHKTHF